MYLNLQDFHPPMYIYILQWVFVSERDYSKFCLYHLVSKDIRSSYNNSVPISG